VQRIGGTLRVFIGVAALVAVAGVGAARAADAPAAGPAGGAAAVQASAAAAAKKTDAPQQPVRISADTAEYQNTEGLVLFTGNVVAVQADAKMTAERMEVTFVKEPVPEGAPAGGIGAPSTAQRIATIVALGKVSFRQVDPDSGKERYATGDKGVYHLEERLATLSGNARLWEGKNVIVGEEMVFHLADKKVVVKGKVNLTVYPEENKAEKKP
jgi:lipopolysaccharide export system protein LptA